jgi:DNA-binding protein YbaB
MLDKLKMMGALANLMKDQDKLKEAGARIRERAGTIVVTGRAGGGAAVARVSGQLKVMSVELSPALVGGMAADDRTRELAASLIAEAVNDALTRARAKHVVDVAFASRVRRLDQRRDRVTGAELQDAEPRHARGVVLPTQGNLRHHLVQKAGEGAVAAAKEEGLVAAVDHLLRDAARVELRAREEEVALLHGVAQRANHLRRDLARVRVEQNGDLLFFDSTGDMLDVSAKRLNPHWRPFRISRCAPTPGNHG